VIIENNLTTAEQVTNYVKAGGGCGTCLVDSEDIITSVQQEQAATTARVAAELSIIQERTQSPLTTVQKITLIQKALDEVRPMLMADGGDVELFDVDGDVVKVILKGSCGSCPNSTATLKDAIEVRIKEKVLPNLVVEAV
jgi:NifU-like protein